MEYLRISRRRGGGGRWAGRLASLRSSDCASVEWATSCKNNRAVRPPWLLVGVFEWFRFRSARASSIVHAPWPPSSSNCNGKTWAAIPGPKAAAGASHSKNPQTIPPMATRVYTCAACQARALGGWEPCLGCRGWAAGRQPAARLGRLAGGVRLLGSGTLPRWETRKAM